MPFLIKFATNFSSFKIYPKFDRYLFNTFDLLLLIQQAVTSKLEIENKDKKNIGNVYDFN